MSAVQVPFSVTCGACHMQSHQPVVPGATCSICTREGNSLVIVKSLKGTLHKDDGEVVDQVRIPSKFVDSVLARDPVQLYTNDPDDMELLLHKLEVTGSYLQQLSQPCLALLCYLASTCEKGQDQSLCAHVHLVHALVLRAHVHPVDAPVCKHMAKRACVDSKAGKCSLASSSSLPISKHMQIACKLAKV